MKHRACRPRPETIRELEEELAEMKLIAAVAKDVSERVPLGEIFNLLRKQLTLTDEQRRALDLWDAKHSKRHIYVETAEYEDGIAIQ